VTPPLPPRPFLPHTPSTPPHPMKSPFKLLLKPLVIVGLGVLALFVAGVFSVPPAAKSAI